MAILPPGPTPPDEDDARRMERVMAMRNDPDAALLRAVRGGDYDAFEALVDRHGARLFALASAIVRQREDAEDIVQTSFMNAIEHLDDFRGDASFATWLTRIATNNALKTLRKRRGLELVPLDGDGDEPATGLPHPEFIADWRDDPVALLERGEIRAFLDDAMAALPEGQRLVFVLRDLQGFSVAETADALGIAPGNVKVRLLRARLALREKLTRAFGDPGTRVAAAPDGGHDHARDDNGGPHTEASR